jgi:hypothetical protein
MAGDHQNVLQLIISTLSKKRLANAPLPGGPPRITRILYFCAGFTTKSILFDSPPASRINTGKLPAVP